MINSNLPYAQFYYDGARLQSYTLQCHVSTLNELYPNLNVDYCLLLDAVAKTRLGRCLIPSDGRL